jgi:ribonucleoside-diphosphate reductase beta chain
VNHAVYKLHQGSENSLIGTTVGNYKAINWNAIEDQLDKLTYEKLTSQFWLATRMPVSKDKADWSKLSEKEQVMIEKVFAGLTMLDTLQSEIGVSSLKEDVRTKHETAVLNNIDFMESEHARSYSSIYSTLNTNKEIRDIFLWANTNEILQKKTKIIKHIYQNGTPLQKKIASVYLESFMFYSGFYTPLWYLGNSKLMNVAEVIKLIIRDESVHGSYIGYKFSLGYKELSAEEQKEMKNYAYDLLYELYELECKYTEYLYDEIGWTEDVKVFLRYNANKSLQNLRFEPLFVDSAEDVNPIVLNGLTTGTNNHDFFSAVGNGYLMSVVEEMNDDDYIMY